VTTQLQLGDRAVVELTGLRNPCRQIDEFQPGLLEKVLERDEEGAVVYRVGVMSVVVRDGAVRPGDEIHVILPPQPHHALELV
jgi:MOSC domain-containing protein YiiM